VYNPSYCQVQTGPDCSGLVWLAYEEIGVFLPRNARDQCSVGQSITPCVLRIGDLVFTAPCHGTVNHVLICLGPTLIEATARDGAVVRETFPEERFGLSFSSSADGSIVNDTKLFFRRYLL
jgi:cell wall-associated NlpC family hydrolase